MTGRKEIAKEYLEMINKNLDSKPDYFKGYVNFMADSSVRTKYRYVNHVISFMKKIKKEPEDLVFEDFNDYISSITYKEDGTKNSSSYQINIYSALKKFNEYLYVSKRVKENYMLYIKKPKMKESQETVVKRTRGYLTEEELKKYIKSVETKSSSIIEKPRNYMWDVRDKAIILVFLYTGIRCSALRMIDVEDVDLKHKKIIVTDKGEKVRVYEIPDKLCKTLEDWLNYRHNFMGENSTDALFISLQKNRMNYKTIYNVVQKYSDTIDKNITPHKLRATYGTQLYNKTKDIYFVQRCLGHSSPKTSELYIRDVKENTKHASDIMDKIL